jgi:hypothetical protein
MLRLLKCLQRSDNQFRMLASLVSLWLILIMIQVSASYVKPMVNLAHLLAASRISVCHSLTPQVSLQVLLAVLTTLFCRRTHFACSAVSKVIMAKRKHSNAMLVHPIVLHLRPTSLARSILVFVIMAFLSPKMVLLPHV